MNIPTGVTGRNRMTTRRSRLSLSSKQQTRSSKVQKKKGKSSIFHESHGKTWQAGKNDCKTLVDAMRNALWAGNECLFCIEMAVLYILCSNKVMLLYSFFFFFFFKSIMYRFYGIPNIPAWLSVNSSIDQWTCKTNGSFQVSDQHHSSFQPQRPEPIFYGCSSLFRCHIQ